MEELRAGRTILMDGATGTEIERRGVATVQDAWSSSGALTGPDVVRQVHEDYLRAGARIIISNTFATSRHTLADGGLEHEFETLNRLGVELARQARDGTGSPALVAGGITHWSFTGSCPSLDVLGQNAAEQAKIMAAAGADMLVLEMMSDVDRTLTLLHASQQTGVPVWVGFSCEIDEAGTVRLLDGPTLVEGVAAIEGRDVPVVSIMHTEVSDIDPCLDVLDEVWSGPVGVYAHSGHFVNPNWVFNDIIAPADYAAAARGWLDRGVQVVGGCCGIGPEHLALLRPLVDG